MAGRSFMHNLGCFFGEIVKGITTRPDRNATRYEIYRNMQQAQSTKPGGQVVTLRRTTIEEVEYAPTPQTGPHNS